MQWFGTTYTRRFNLEHFQNGHLFQGRFKSILVQNNAYLMQLSYYIHNNPLRAGIVKRLMDYRWSSYPAYAYNRSHPKWLDKKLILSQIMEKIKIGNIAKSPKNIPVNTGASGKMFAMDSFMDLESL